MELLGQFRRHIILSAFEIPLWIGFSFKLTLLLCSSLYEFELDGSGNVAQQQRGGFCQYTTFFWLSFHHTLHQFELDGCGASIERYLSVHQFLLIVFSSHITSVLAWWQWNSSTVIMGCGLLVYQFLLVVFSSQITSIWAWWQWNSSTVIMGRGLLVHQFLLVVFSSLNCIFSKSSPKFFLC